MTTLLLSEVFPPKTGGSGRWYWEVYRRLPRAEYRIAAGEDPRQAAFDRTHDLNVFRMPLALPAWGLKSWAGLRGYYRALRRLRPLVRGHGVERVHAARCLPEGFMAWCLKRWFGVPYLCYVHGEEITCTSASRELRWLARRVVAGADFLIANSRNTAGIAQELWKARPGRVRVLHPGVDTSRFTPAPPDPAARAALGWSGRRVVLTVGRLQRRKGHDQMIRALPAVAKAVPEVLYAIVGGGEEEPYLRRLAAEMGVADRVQFLGEPDDAGLVRCYRQCDLFVLPNRQEGMDIEGFGIVLLEAQACGKPVVAGASGGTAEAVGGPETGLLVDCTSAGALAATVAGLLGDPERLARMGEAARRRVVERFDWGPLSREAEGLFRLLGRRGRTPAEVSPG
ncbi:MAG TPA: glycosyltransferase family 4 protein [Gemmataceae bacterium]